MAEVIRRRFRKYAIAKSKGEAIRDGGDGAIGSWEVGEGSVLSPSQLSDFPDLVMIDGGKGQLSAVVAVLRELNLLEDVKVVSLAKQRERDLFAWRIPALADGRGASRSPVAAPLARRGAPICGQLPPPAAIDPDAPIAPRRDPRTGPPAPKGIIGGVSVDRLHP